LGKNAEQMKKHPSAGGARVDGLIERDEVGVLLPEEVENPLTAWSMCRPPPCLKWITNSARPMHSPRDRI
jgi:hypothetical protein